MKIEPPLKTQKSRIPPETPVLADLGAAYIKEIPQIKSMRKIG